MTLKVDRFEAEVAKRGIELKIDGKNVITIKDHTTDKIVAMVNLENDPDLNLDLAESVIAAIETWIVEHEN